MSKRGTKWRDSSAPLLSDDQTAHAQSRDFHAPGGRPPKIRKDTYVVRKEESIRLSEQISALSAQADALRRKQQKEGRGSIPVVVAQNADMSSTIDSQKQMLWGAHALLSDWMNMPFESPMSTFIHLTSDFHERRQTLLGMKLMKLQMAERFLRLHSQQLHLLRPHVTESHFENAQGGYFATRVEVEQFDGAQSVKDVFDALLYSEANVEIAVSEKLGHITLREDVDTIDGGVWNSRLVSRDTHGTQCEMNCVTFTQFQADRVFGGCESPGFGILVTDFVDKDDLYPYQPSQNVRRDVSVVCMLTPHRRPQTQQTSLAQGPTETALATRAKDSDEIVVVLQHIVFEKIHHSDLPIDEPAMRTLRQGAKSWGDIIVDGIHDRLAATRMRAAGPKHLDV